jgi:hypothetical protein
MATMDEIKAKVQALATDGKISCKHSLNIADELGVPPRMVGEACNELDIKIAACQLGCFA